MVNTLIYPRHLRLFKNTIIGVDTSRILQYICYFMNISKNSKCNQLGVDKTFGAGNNNVIYGDANHIRGVNRKYNFL